jgi:hypothetical protein
MAFKRDYDFGKQQEEILLPLLSNFFNQPLTKTDPTCQWDYEGPDTLFEVKSRTNPYSKYPTTLLPFDKVIEGKRQIFVFNFTDGIYFIEYNKDQFDTFIVKDFRRFRQGVRDKEKPYLFIPIDTLTKIERPETH